MRRAGVAVIAMLGLLSACASVPNTPGANRPDAADTPEVSRPVRPPAPPGAPVPPPPAGRDVAVGEVFRLRIGETVGVSGEDLVVTYVQLLSDNRCSPGVQCIVAGNARITVTVGSDTDPPASFVLNTDQTPRSGRYQDRTVELVGLSHGSRPAASLKVT